MKTSQLSLRKLEKIVVMHRCNVMGALHSPNGIRLKANLFDGELSHHMNTRVPSEPRYDLRKRNHSQQ